MHPAPNALSTLSELQCEFGLHAGPPALFPVLPGWPVLPAVSSTGPAQRAFPVPLPQEPSAPLPLQLEHLWDRGVCCKHPAAAGVKPGLHGGTGRLTPLHVFP